MKNTQNPMAKPKLIKVVVGVGAGKATEDPKYIDVVAEDLSNITGQRPIKTKSKKAISGFKIRKGIPIGLKVTLRGKRMKDFLSKVIKVVLPRIRDFRGVKESAINGGSLNIGIKEHFVFPEIKQESIQKNFGLQITAVSDAKSKEEAREFFQGLGVVFEKTK